MTEEAQRIAIAAACGYTNIHRGWPYGQMWGEHLGGDPAVPDYLHDLNAMHEAEKTLTESQYDQFIIHLHFAWSGYLLKRKPACLRQIVQATAAQRAEAFLKTLGLWRSSDTSQTPTPTQ